MNSCYSTRLNNDKHVSQFLGLHHLAYDSLKTSGYSLLIDNKINTYRLVIPIYLLDKSFRPINCNFKFY